MPNADFPDFAVLDAPRAHANTDLGRVIGDAFGFVEPHIPEIDGWCSMPLRLVHDAAAGWHVECGPYDLDAADILQLKRAIVAYEQAIGRTLACGDDQ